MKDFTIFILIFLISGFSFGQTPLTNKYDAFREQIRGISPLQLENIYQRPQSYYYKGFSQSLNSKPIHYLDSVKQKLELTEDEINLLQQNRFFVSERMSYQTFGNALHTVYNLDLPVFVSTDAILHALHMSYGQILKSLEREIMAGNLEQFLAWLYNNFDVLTQKYGDSDDLSNSLKDADLYVTIAYSLITGKLQNGHVEDSAKIKQVWDRIFEEKMAQIPLFTFPNRKRKIDFSQFTVRGHYVYTEQEKWMGIKSLEPYFRTMMWLGRIDFLLTPPPPNPWETKWSIQEIARMHQSAFLVNEILELCPERHLLDFNENIINYLLGESDNLLPAEYTGILKNMNVSTPDQLTDTSTVKSIISSFNNHPQLSQKILSDFFFMDPNSDAPGDLPISYRLSGQRFIIDSYILGNVVFDRLMQNGEKVMRMMPNPLDALFVLGNNDALPLLEPEFEKYQYAEQLAKLRFLVDYKPDEFWSSSLYNVWLNGIRELNPRENETNLPLFMQTAAWHHEKINTQLASWAQLRHDNLLYAKQSYTGGTGCSFPHSFVEPYPDFYGRLKEFAQNAGEFFAQMPTSNSEVSRVIQFFPNFEMIMEKLETLADKELKNTAFTEEELDWLKSMLFFEGGSGVPPYSGWYTQLFYDVWDAAEGDFTIVDIHTQPTDEAGNQVGKVLHAGVGKINLGVFITDCPNFEGMETAFVGPVMSYYESITNNFKRLTDQEWEQMVYDQHLPKRPEWTHIYLAGEKGEMKGNGIELPSKLYTSIIETEWRETELSIYPNPATDKVSIQTRNFTSNVVIEVYNTLGVLVKQISPDNSNHQNIQFDISDLKPGIYLVGITNGKNEKLVSKLIKKQGF